MMFRFPVALLLVLLAAPALAQDAAKLASLPNAFALTRAVEGDWEEEDDYIAESYEAVEKAADRRGIALSSKRVLIRQVMGLKTFKAQVGYLVEGTARPATFSNDIELRRLPANKAWVAAGKGDSKAVIAVRRRVLDEAEKPGVKRLKGVELIEIFDGEPDQPDTAFQVFAPLAAGR